MTVSQMSLLAYYQLENVNAKQKACYKVIESLKNACNYDIANSLHIPINTVTPRVLELRGLGLVEQAYKDINPATDRKVTFWRICGAY